MATLHNKYDRRILKEKIKQSTEDRYVVSCYKYLKIEDPVAFRNRMYVHFSNYGILGRIYVAHEGTNMQISVPAPHMQQFKTILTDLDSRLSSLYINVAVDNKADAFFMLKIKVRKKIVADGIDDFTFDPSDTGAYLDAEGFNKLSAQPDSVVVDMRNHYEYEVGHFKDAITYSSDTFREQIPGTIDLLQEHRNKNILLYCTGGIRCEKTSAYFKHQGFKNVYHLHGGIINYAHQVHEKNLENKFVGKNFVFDERLGEVISSEIIAHCHQCGSPCDTHTNCANEGCHLLFIQCPQCKATYQNCCSEACKDNLALPTELRKTKRKGVMNGQNIFNKSKEALRERFDIFNATP